MPDIVVAKGDPEYLNLPTSLVGLVLGTLACVFFLAAIIAVARRSRLWPEEKKQRLTGLILGLIAVESGVMAIALFVFTVEAGAWAR